MSSVSMRLSLILKLKSLNEISSVMVLSLLNSNNFQLNNSPNTYLLFKIVITTLVDYFTSSFK